MSPRGIKAPNAAKSNVNPAFILTLKVNACSFIVIFGVAGRV
jgi:hypothetical protein